MRDRQRTLEALRRLAERPGSPQEGETARRLLAMMDGAEWIPKPFDPALFPLGTVVFYCCWAHRNYRGIVTKGRDGLSQTHHGQTWMRLKFDHLKNARWVPVTSELGCHIGLVPFEGNEEETLYRRDVDWQEHDRQFREQCASLGIDLTPISERVPHRHLTPTVK
jgi:hypothetical protein